MNRLQKTRGLFVFVTLLIISFSMISCEKEKNPMPSTVKKTVFMYLPWSTNLTSNFYTNISDMESVVAQGILDNERVLVFISTSPTRATLLELEYDRGKCKRNTLKDYVSPAFTTSRGITSILNDVRTFAPAKQYSMIIGCHGMGWLPVSATTHSRSITPEKQKRHWEYEGGLMTRYFGGLTDEFQTDITTLAEGISNAGIKMEYILFDDCYMSSIEVAYELKDVTDYLIASPCEIMAYGMPYAKIGPYLLGTADYESICNTFYDFYSNYTLMPCGTIGVTACSELESLAAIMKEINGTHTFDSSLLNSIQRLDGYSPTIFFDCGDYVTKLCTDTELLTRFKEQLERSIPYKRHTPSYYTMSNGGMQIPIKTFSGTTISDPTRDSEASGSKFQTAWYKATH